MKFSNGFLTLALLSILKWAEAGIGNPPVTAETSYATSTTSESAGTSSVTTTTTQPSTPKEPEYFTPGWLQMFTKKQLAVQPKWYLADEQPGNGTFQVRTYPMQWWSRSFQECRTIEEASSQGYMDLYFLFNGYNYQRQSFPLTYPVLLDVDERIRVKPTRPPKTIKLPKWCKKPKNKAKKRCNPKKMPVKKTAQKACPKYMTFLYLPIPLTKWAPVSQNEAIKSLKRNELTYYVREYAGNYTTAYCAEQAEILANDLSLRGQMATAERYLCARYEPPIGREDQKLEVWMMKHKVVKPMK